MDRDPHGKKIGRNQKCWCGSSLKYKNCHYARKHQTPHDFGRYTKGLFETQRAIKLCSCDFDRQKCTAHFVNAHSVSKTSSLQHISNEGHVLTLEVDPNLPGGPEGVVFKKIGVNKASTVQAFCSYHDRELFRQLDQLDLRDEALFFWQLFYRTVCFERHRKIVAARFVPQLRALDRGLDFDEQVSWQDFITRQQIGHSAGFQQLEHVRTRLEKIYINQQTSNELRYLYFVLPERVPVALSGVFQPDLAPDGTFLQTVNQMKIENDGSVTSPPLNALCMSILPHKTGTLLSMCAISDHLNSVTFMRIFIEIAKATIDNFVGLAIAKIENAFFEPRFVNSLTAFDKHKLRALHSFGVGIDLTANEMRLAMTTGLFPSFDRLSGIVKI